MPILAALALVGLVYLFTGLRQINQWEVGLRFTLGRYSQSLWPGFAAELEAASGMAIGYETTGTLVTAFTRDQAAKLRPCGRYVPTDTSTKCVTAPFAVRRCARRASRKRVSKPSRTQTSHSIAPCALGKLE